MIRLLAAIYAAWPLRSHCRQHAHTWLCRHRMGIGPDCDFDYPGKG